MFRNLSYLIILLFCGAVSLQAQEREYVIVVHGGAGVIDKLEKDPERSAQYYAALDSALTIGDRILSAGGGRSAGCYGGNQLF
ncbi:isoaspartyl peptidase/L-asparaginase [Parabacteroides faecis]|nr:isoaspartyl peptidase/L-asparaginase [Parabacteroides faecis]